MNTLQATLDRLTSDARVIHLAKYLRVPVPQLRFTSSDFEELYRRQVNNWRSSTGVKLNALGCVFAMGGLVDIHILEPQLLPMAAVLFCVNLVFWTTTYWLGMNHTRSRPHGMLQFGLLISILAISTWVNMAGRSPNVAHLDYALYFTLVFPSLLLRVSFLQAVLSNLTVLLLVILTLEIQPDLSMESHSVIIIHLALTSLAALTGNYMLELKARKVFLANHELAMKQKELEGVNRELERASNLDALTGLPNRRALQAYVDDKLKHAQEDAEGLFSLLLFDLDYFKLYNDHYGRQKGDACLQWVSTCLENLPLDDGMIARYGGEKFIVILLGKDATAAKVTGEQILEVIADMNLPHANSLFGKVTMSMGIASGMGSDAFYTTLDIADNALYEAKARGRNRIVVANEDSTGGMAGPVMDTAHRILQHFASHLLVLGNVIPDLAWIKDIDGRYVSVNASYAAWAGGNPADMLGKTYDEVFDIDTIGASRKADIETLCGTGVSEMEEVIKKDGKERIFYVRRFALRDSSGTPVGIMGAARDVTDMRKREDEVRKSKDAYQHLVDGMPENIARLKRGDGLLICNDAMREFATERLGLNGQITYNEEGLPVGAPDFVIDMILTAQNVLDTGKLDTKRFEFETLDGEHLTHEVVFTPEFEFDGPVSSVLMIGRDITAQLALEETRKKHEKELNRLAYEDPLTGLLNRNGFERAANEAVSIAMERGCETGLLLIDIDQFKSINNTLGYQVGDNFLRRFAKRLGATLPADATLARLSGDEFVAIINGMDSTHSLSNIAQSLIDTMTDPLRVGGHKIAATASIGIASTLRDTQDPFELFQFGEIALFEAKKRGRNQFVPFSTELSQYVHDNFKLVSAMNDSLGQDHFLSYYQAKVDLKTGRIVGAEALSRWNHPTLGPIPPCRFIPIAEENGAIAEIGRRVLLDACRFTTAVNASSAWPFKVAVNVSPRQLQSGDFSQVLTECMIETGCRPEWLELELTEGILLNDNEVITSSIADIAEKGISIAVDDFGTGYSALSYLTRFPINVLKIDRSFVLAMQLNPRQEVVVETIIDMAHRLGMTTVAEGVETDENLEKLLALGCQLGQGYLWNKPASREDFEALLRTEGGPLANEVSSLRA